MQSWKVVAGALVAAGLAGCGGGGGDAAPVFSFPPPTAASFAQEKIGQSVVSGDCTGARVSLRGVLAPATFAGQGVSGVTTTTDRILANCAGAGSTSSWQTSYYDTNFAVVGDDNSSGAVAVSDTPLALPASLKAGDAGSYGSQTVYADSTRAKVLDRGVYTYAVQPETATTALLVVTSTVSDASGNLLLTEKSTSRLGTDGTRVLLSVDDQYTTPSPLHLVYTPGTAALTLSAGATVTLGAGQLLLVPAGTSVAASGGTSSLQNHLGTITAPAGAVVTVPADATGAADNVVMAR